MTTRFRIGRVVLAAIAASAAFHVAAAPLTFTGADQFANRVVNADGEAAKAQARFLAALDKGSDKREGLESFDLGAVAPLVLNFGDVKVDLAMAPNSSFTGRIENREEDQGVIPGRFNTTPDPAGGSSDTWWQSAGSFTLQFGQLVSAFGFYGTDFFDFGGTLELEFLQGSTLISRETVQAQSTTPPPVQSTSGPNEIDPDNPDNGSLIFFGFAETDAARRFDSVRVLITQTGSSNDILGFDDLIIGSITSRPGDLPEPATLALVGASLLGLAATRRRQRR